MGRASSHRICGLRTSMAALALILAAPGAALAADMPDFLRGSYSPSYGRWDGFYAGGHFGGSAMSNNFGEATRDELAFILRNTTLEDQFSPSNWTVLGSSSTNSLHYGGFFGYNWQWDQLVLGVDVGYTHMSSMANSANETIARTVTTTDHIQHNVTITAQSSIKLIDYAAVRGRAAYAFGQFLPYATLGFAVGRFNYSNTVALSDAQTDVTTPPGTFLGTFVDSASDARDNTFQMGFVGGLGMDMQLMPNLFLRAEWELVDFWKVGGILTTVNSGRVGVGARF
ncbi:MAG TPA: outer membrane beta-barrel protein [Pseudolabrys sp.]|nr:outer membrane beta-barrel protein [Pseudolabrys sp.]